MTQKASLEHYDLGDVIGHGSFGIIRKVQRKADGAVRLYILQVLD